MPDPLPFWKTKTLDELNPEEWESLCDGCARCCLVKLEDEDTAAIHLTRLSCSMLDIGACRCSDYANRKRLMPDCLSIDPEAVRRLAWLPATCGYRTIEEGRDLAWWHPLVSGSTETVHEAGISVRAMAISEAKIDVGELHRYIIEDYARPRRAAKARRGSAKKSAQSG